MKKQLTLLFATFFVFAYVAKGQTVSYSTSASTITQNFNTLPTSGTQAITTPFNLSVSPVGATGLDGWYVSKVGGTIANLIAGNGSSNTGGAYNFGTGTNTDRSLGSLASANIPRLGVLITNNTGGTLTSFVINFTGEQWRNGGSNNVNKLSFFYKVGATNIDDATGYLANTAGDFSSQVSSAATATLDGNATANRAAVSVTITGISWADGQVLGLRWDDANDSGADDALAIDDWSFKAPASTTPNVSLSISPSSGSEDAATVATLTATASAPVVGDQTVDVVVSGAGITTGDYTLSATTITILNGQTTGTATFTVVDDALVEGTETATIALTNPSSGISLSAAASQTFAIADNDGYTYYSQSSGLHTAAIWAITPVGAPGVALFNPLSSFVVQNGHTVTLNSSGVDMKNLTVNAGGKFYTNTTGTLRYLNVFGSNVVNNGTIGDGAVGDGLSFNVEGTNCTISGSGVTDLSRIRKNTSTNPVTNLIIDQNVNLRFNGAAFYNNASSDFNLTINSGATLDVIGSTGSNGDFAIDGTTGTSGTASRGVVNVNGKLIVSNTLYALSNNGSGNTGININSGGEVKAKNVNVDLVTGSAPFVFDVKSGGNLKIENSLNLLAGAFNPAGTVTLLSTADNQCAYIDNFSVGYTGTVGTVTAQRFVPDAGLNQHFISSPIANTSFTDIGAVSGADGVFVTPSGTCDENNLAVGSNYGNFFEWSEANVGGACILKGWKVRSAGTLNPAQGYSAYLNGNTIFDVTGIPNQGLNYSIPITRGSWATTTTLQGNSYQSGWNLVGNPFLTTVNLIAKTDIDNDVKIYNTTGPYQGTYSTVFAGSGSAYIAPFQGFYVRKSSVGSGNFDVKKGECVTNAATFNKNGENVVKLIVSGNGFKDKTNIGFEGYATKDFDNGFDAVKFISKGGQPSIYTMIDDVKAEYNIANTIVETPTMDVYFQAGADGNFELSFEELSNLPQHTKVVLEDKKLQSFTTVEATTKYTFASSTTDAKNRFSLHFSEVQTPTDTTTTTGIQTIKEKGVEIYTAGNKLFVNTKEAQSPVKGISLYNVIGQEIFNANTSNILFVKSLENVNLGIVIVRVTLQNGQQLSKTVLVNHQ